MHRSHLPSRAEALPRMEPQVLPWPSGVAELALNTFAPSMPSAAAIRRNRARLAYNTFGESRADEYQAPAGD